jgi:kynurenine 3-monooxygenase
MFNDFGTNHVENGHAIANMALENYIEMRDSVNNLDYKKHREVELLLERRFPNRFIPRYSMVSFHEIPYAEVYRRGEIQLDLISKFVSGEISEVKLNEEIIKNLSLFV